jgi:hypothetical protein
VSQPETTSPPATEPSGSRQPADWQLAVDARDAHTLADFWIEALGYQLEDNTGFIEDLVDKGVAPASLTHRRPDGVLSWAGLEAIRGAGRRILFHTVPEPKTVKNRWHIDVTVGKDRMHAEAERLVGLGATLVREVQEPGGHFLVMQDPEGNEFCLQ